MAQKIIDEQLKIQSMNKMFMIEPEEIMGHFLKRNDIGPDGIRTKMTDQEAINGLD